MMRVFFLLFTLAFISPLHAQQHDSLKTFRSLRFFDHSNLNLSGGAFIGMNYARWQGDLLTGEWETQAGPSSGLYVDYSLNRFFSLHTELLYQKLYYQYKDYNSTGRGWLEKDPGPVLWTEPAMSSIIPYPVYTWGSRQWNYSFYRIPLQIQFHTPSRLRFELGAGLVFSFLDRYDASGLHLNYYPPIYLHSAYSPVPGDQEEKDLPRHDWGMMYSAGLSYPVSEHLSIGLSGRLYSGHRVFMKGIEGQTEVPEWVCKIGYTGFSYQPDGSSNKKNRSSGDVLFLTWHAGLLLGNHRGGQFQNTYSSRLAPSAGLSLDWQFGTHFSLQTGLAFNRKGYHMQDSTISPFRLVETDRDHLKAYSDTRVDLDYLMVPLVLNLHFGDPFTFYINGGFYHGFLITARTTGTLYEEHTSGMEYKREEVSVYDHMEGYIRGNDWGWIAGGGIRMPLGDFWKLDMGLSYDQSLINNYKSLEKRGALSEDRAFFNESFQWTVGVRVPIH